MMPPDAILELKGHQNAFVARASPRTPLGKLTALPRPLAGFKGATSKGRGREGRGGEGNGPPPPNLVPWLRHWTVVEC